MPVQIGKAGAGARQIARRRAVRICLTIIVFIVLGSGLSYVGNRLLRIDTWLAYLVGLLVFGLGIGFLIAVIKASIGKEGEELDRAVKRAVKGAGAEEKVSE